MTEIDPTCAVEPPCTVTPPSLYSGQPESNFTVTVTPDPATASWSASSPVPWVEFPACAFPMAGPQTVPVRIILNAEGFREATIMFGATPVVVKQEGVVTPVPPEPEPGPDPDPDPDAPYAAACQDREVREKPPLPELGIAGFAFSDPAFGSRLLRVTDGSSGGSWRVASNVHVATWNADSSRFYLLGPNGKQVMALDGGVPRPLATISSQGEPTFSRSDPDRIYGVGGPSTRTVQASTIDADGNVAVTDLLDLDTLGLALVEPRTYVGGMVTSDESVAVFFGGAGQDQHHYAGVLREGETVLAALVDTLTEPGCGFKLHSISIDRTGRFVVLYPVNAKPFHMVIWDTEAQTFTPVTEAPWGHDTQGYGWEINHDCSPAQEWDAAQWQRRRLDALDTSEDLITPVLRPKETYLDDHTSWHNARADRLLPVITATYRYNDDGSVPWRAWDDEIIAIATDGPSTVYRFCHHRTDARDESNPLNTYFWYQPLASVSPDGAWAVFSSNWEKSLGPDPSDPGRSRQDVFLVRLAGGQAP